MTKGSLGLFNLNFLAKGISSSSSSSITLLPILIVVSVFTSLTSEVEGFNSEGSEVDCLESEGLEIEGLGTEGLVTEGLTVASVSTSLTLVFLFEELLERRRRFRSNVLEVGGSEVEGLDTEGSEVEGLDSEGSDFEGLENEEARDGGSLFSRDISTIGFDGFL